MDLCGPMKTTTLGGARYFMLIIDDFSRKVWVYLLVEKSQAFTKFQEYRAYSVSTSLTEAEYRAYLDTCCELLWLMQLFYHVGVLQDSPIAVYTVSQSARALAHSSTFHGRTKHIEVHYHFVRELAKSQVINLAYCPTQENVADYLLSHFQGKPLISSSVDSMLDRRSTVERRC